MALDKSKKKYVLQIISDILIFIALFVVYATVTVRVRPAQRGFFCDDESIQYPYHHDTVTAKHLLVFFFAVVPLCFLLVEFPRHWFAHRQSFIRHALRSAAKQYGVFMFGLLVTMVITEFGKLSVGRLRPHFIRLCKPDFDQINCSQGYIEDFVCTNNRTHPYLLQDARKSFPSGHASLAVCTAVYLGYYLHVRVSYAYTVLLRLVLQVVLAVIAFYTCLSRVADNKHHYGDVIGGGVIGLAVAVWLVFCLRRTLGYVRPTVDHSNRQHQTASCVINVDETEHGEGKQRERRLSQDRLPV